MITALIIVFALTAFALAFTLGILHGRATEEEEEKEDLDVPINRLPPPEFKFNPDFRFNEYWPTDYDFGYLEEQDYFPSDYEIYDVHRFHKSTPGTELEEWLKKGGYLG
jgi:hypothetical protein